jgi:uncharacterized protein YggU (UPF0235/DUF167 family)
MSNDAGQAPMCAMHENDLKWIRGTLVRIEAQTTATNGRLRSLERWRIALAASIGGLLVGQAANAGVVKALLAAFAGAQ